jgi:hypothetical protein
VVYINDGWQCEVKKNAIVQIHHYHQNMYHFISVDSVCKTIYI